MKTKIRNIVISAIFVMGLMIPIIFTNHIDGKVSAEEKRVLASFPKVFDEAGKFHLENFNKEFETWISDNIGFRESFIKLHATMMYKIFGISPNDQVSIGKDGWFFYTKDENLDIAKGNYPLDENTLHDIVAGQEDIREHLEEKGMNYYFISAYSKASIYPEKIKGNYDVIETPADKLRNSLTMNTSVKAINIKDSLLELKASKQLYFKTDTHWNSNGAYAGYQAIYKYLKEQGEITNEMVQVTEEPGTYKGEFSGMMGSDTLLAPEKTVNCVVVNPKATLVTEGEKRQNLDQILTKYGYQDPCYLYENPGIQGKKVVMFGDSMFAQFGMPSFLAENFSEFVYIWNSWMNEEIIDYFKPDIVIFQKGERYTKYIGDYNRMYWNTVIPTPVINPNYELVGYECTDLEDGTAKQLTITVKNTGESTWTGSNHVGMYVYKDGDTGIRAEIVPGVKVQPGEQYTFRLETQDSCTQVSMVQDGVTYFGPISLLEY